MTKYKFNKHFILSKHITSGRLNTESAYTPNEVLSLSNFSFISVFSALIRHLVFYKVNSPRFPSMSPLSLVTIAVCTLGALLDTLFFTSEGDAGWCFLGCVGCIPPRSWVRSLPDSPPPRGAGRCLSHWGLALWVSCCFLRGIDSSSQPQAPFKRITLLSLYSITSTCSLHFPSAWMTQQGLYQMRATWPCTI